jgi:hypothetical protein
MNGTDIETSEYLGVGIGGTSGSVTPASSQPMHPATHASRIHRGT